MFYFPFRLSRIATRTGTPPVSVPSRFCHFRTLTDVFFSSWPSCSCYAGWRFPIARITPSFSHQIKYGVLLKRFLSTSKPKSGMLIVFVLVLSLRLHCAVAPVSCLLDETFLLAAAPSYLVFLRPPTHLFFLIPHVVFQDKFHPPPSTFWFEYFVLPPPHPDFFFSP